MDYPKIPAGLRLQRLEPPQGKIRMVLDTDTYNEVDDQFALAYAVRSEEKISLEAVYAAPFHNDRSSGPRDGMESSYNEIKSPRPDGLLIQVPCFSRINGLSEEQKSA